MPRRRKDPPKHWHFWRSGFWTRPVFIVMLSLFVAGVGVWFLSTVPGEFSDARGILNAGECTAGQDAGCLRRITVEADGPYYSRGPGDDWLFFTTGRGERRLVDEVDISTAGSNKLDGERYVEVLIWENEVVVVETAEGERIETDEYGHGGWIFPLSIGLFALSGGYVGIQYARGKRLGADSWWSTWSETTGLIRPTPVNLAVGVVFFGSMVAPIAMGIGATAVTAGVIGAAATTGLAALVVWGWRRRHRRARR